MRTIDKVSFSPKGFTAIIVGNGGEEELNISMSPGQSGRCPIIAVATGCDGDLEVILSKTEYHMAPNWEDMASWLILVITKWTTSGIKPNAKQYASLSKKIDSSVKR